MAATETVRALSPVTVRARQIDLSPKEDKAPKGGDKKKKPAPKEDIGVKSLEVEVRNAGRNPIDGATLRYRFFGLKKGDTEIVVLKNGKQDMTLPPGEAVTVTTDKVRAKYQYRGIPEEKDMKTGEVTRTKVEAGSERLRGYGVCVEHNDEVLAEYFITPQYERVADEADSSTQPDSVLQME